MANQGYIESEPSIYQVLGSSFGVSDIREIGEGYAVLLTFAFAIATSIFAFFINAEQRKREYRLANSSQFLASQSEMVKQAMRKLAVLRQKDLSQESFNSILRDMYDDFFIVAVHFETASVYMSTGYASERVIARVEGGNMERFFESIFPYIQSVRTYNDDTLKYYESFYLKRKFIRFSFVAYVLGLAMRNPLTTYRALFRFYYGILRFLNLVSPSYFEEDLERVRRSIFQLRLLFSTIFILSMSWLFDLHLIL